MRWFIKARKWITVQPKLLRYLSFVYCQANLEVVANWYWIIYYLVIFQVNKLNCLVCFCIFCQVVGFVLFGIQLLKSTSNHFYWSFIEVFNHFYWSSVTHLQNRLRLDDFLILLLDGWKILTSILFFLERLYSAAICLLIAIVYLFLSL